MQKLVNSVPLILLLVLTPYFFYNEPNIAQALVLAVIGSLVGFRAYLDGLETPDYHKLFTERLDNKDIEVNEILRQFEKDLANVRDGQNKIALVQKQEDKIHNFKW